MDCFVPQIDDAAGRTAKTLLRYLIAVLALVIIFTGIDGWGGFVAGGVLDGIAYVVVGVGFYGVLMRHRVALLVYAVGESLLIASCAIVPIVYCSISAATVQGSTTDREGHKRVALAEPSSSSHEGSDPEAANALLRLFLAMLGLAVVLLVVILLVVLAVWIYVLSVRIRSILLAVRMARELAESPRPDATTPQAPPAYYVQVPPGAAILQGGQYDQQWSYIPPYMQHQQQNTGLLSQPR
eukprot:m51a1_g6377 hypothetical protein (240) ;mRNA; f:143628-144658